MFQASEAKLVLQWPRGGAAEQPEMDAVVGELPPRRK